MMRTCGTFLFVLGLCLIAFAAEEARVTGRTVHVEEFSRRESATK